MLEALPDLVAELKAAYRLVPVRQWLPGAPGMAG
jgi:hypothetical protein